MLGQPVSMLIPRVVGFKLTGELPAGTTATDLVLTITETAAQARRGRQVRRVLRRRRGRRPARQPGHDRQHEPRVRLHLRDLPDRRRDPDLPAADRPRRPSRSRWSRRTPRSRACGTTRPRPRVLRGARARPVHGRAVAGRPEAPAGPGGAVRRPSLFRDALGDYVAGVGQAGRRGRANTFPASDPVRRQRGGQRAPTQPAAAAPPGRPRRSRRSPWRTAPRPRSTTARWSSPPSPPAPTPPTRRS